MKIKIARSPDSDDAFMLYALEKGKIETGDYEFETHFADIQVLNEKAKNNQEFDISAISFHGYAYLLDNYQLMGIGASFGDNYGPVLICKQDQNPEELLKKIKAGEKTILVPGLLTSATLALKLYAPKVNIQALPFDQIQTKLLENDFAAGLIIHEGQINYENNGFLKLINLGEWWFERTGGLPLPLGCNIVRRSLTKEVKTDLQLILKKSIEYAFQHREEALEYALNFSSKLNSKDVDRFISMYVNELSLDFSLRGQRGIELFFKEAYQLGFIPQLPQ